MKMKEFKGIIKWFYYQNGFRSLPWRGGRVYSRVPSVSMIFINRLKRWTKLTGGWSKLRRGVWSNQRNSMILSQREQWFKIQFFIKIIIFKFLRVWLLNFFNSPIMSHWVIIRDKIKQKVKLNFIITDLLCIIMLIITSLTVWYANMLKLFNRDLQIYCIFLKSLKNTGKISSAISSQTCLSQKVWI